MTVPASAPASSQPRVPLRDDSGTTATSWPSPRSCPVCRVSFAPVGRQQYCGSVCRKTAYRRRVSAQLPSALEVPSGVSRRARTIYQCTSCEGLQLGVQRCTDCLTFGRSLGLGGYCPHCQETFTHEELNSDTG